MLPWYIRQPSMPAKSLPMGAAVERGDRTEVGVAGGVGVEVVDAEQERVDRSATGTRAGRSGRWANSWLQVYQKYLRTQSNYARFVRGLSPANRVVCQLLTAAATSSIASPVASAATSARSAMSSAATAIESAALSAGRLDLFLCRLGGTGQRSTGPWRRRLSRRLCAWHRRRLQQRRAGRGGKESSSCRSTVALPRGSGNRAALPFTRW